MDISLAYKTQCPRCKALGRDNAKDNLAVYTDGHKWCYSCKYYVPAPVEERIRKMESTPSIATPDNDLDFPPDFEFLSGSNAYDSQVNRGRSFLKQYAITEEDIDLHGIGYSRIRDLLVFPIKDAGGNLLAWQGRNFGSTGPKWITKGKVQDILHIIEPVGGSADTIIIVEDIVSAMKVGKMYPSMPLFGSHVPLRLVQRLSTRFKSMGIWLDQDKLRDSLKSALMASQYIETFVVHTARDPKEYATGYITTMVEVNRTKSMIKKEE